jgi:type II secretory pathway pseudopilin PulG
MSLIELVISLMVISVLAAALIHSVLLAQHIIHATSQRVSAFGMARAKFEEVQSCAFSDVATTNFPDETGIRLSHRSGPNQLAVNCTRTVTIQPQTAPERKEVDVSVTWNFLDRTLTETIRGVIYPR